MQARAFVEFLIEEQVIPTGTTNEILETASISGDRVDTVILDLGMASEKVLLSKLGQFTKSQTVPASELMAAPPELTALIPQRLARRFGLIPFRREGKTLWVATIDPGDLLVEDELSLLTGSMIRTFAALEIRIRQGLAKHYRVGLSARVEALARRLDQPEPVTRARQQTHHGHRTSMTGTTRIRPPQQEVPKEARKAKQPPPTELEISEEDLALYPSFAFGTEENATEAEPQPPTAGATPSSTHITVDSPVEDRNSEPPDLSPEARLSRAAEALQGAEIRDDIADAILEFSRPHFDRCMLLALRGDTIIGWRSEGEGIEPAAVRAIAIPKVEPSVFSGLLQGTAFWLGPLPQMPRNQELVFALGDPAPAACLILPIKVRGKIVAFLYGDATDHPLGSVPMADLKRLMAKADIAFQVYLLKGKIRII